MDKMVFGLSGGIILVCIVGFFILSRMRKRTGARFMVRAQEARTYIQLVDVLNQAPANSPAKKLALEKLDVLLLELAQETTTIFQLRCILWMCYPDSQAEKLAWGKLEALLKKEDMPPSRDTLLNKCAQEEFERT